MATWHDLCRGPHFAAPARSARRSSSPRSRAPIGAAIPRTPHASAHLRHRLARREGARSLSAPPRGSGEARPSQAGTRARTFHLLARCGRGPAALDAQRHGDPPGTGIPGAAGRTQGRLSPGGDAAHHQGGAVSTARAICPITASPCIHRSISTARIITCGR